MSSKRTPTPRTGDEVLAEVQTVSERIAALTLEAEELYAHRLGLYHEARAITPAVTHARLATAAGVTEDAVAAALRKDRIAREQRSADEEHGRRGSS